MLPAAVRYQTELALNVGALKAAGVEADTSTLARRSRRRSPSSGPRWPRSSAALADDTATTALAEAEHARDALLPAMAAVRAAADVLEGVVADDLWPLPTYQEMLYIL